MEAPNPKWFAAYTVVLLAAGLVGAGANSFVSSPDRGTEAAQDVLDTLEAQTGQELELLRVEKEDGMYRADIKNSNDRVRAYYVSLTGEMFVPKNSAVDTERVREVARERGELGDCLRTKDVVLYGNISRTSTQLQLRYLGQRYLEDVYRDVNNASVLRTAIQRGVQKTPSFLYNGSTLTGVKSAAEVSRFTSCEYNVSNQS